MKPLDLVNLISRMRLDLSDEKRTQNEIAGLLLQHLDMSLDYRREVSLSKGDRVDFMVGGTAIEVKLKGQRKMDIYRQVKRYTEHAEVDAVIVATNTSVVFPPFINGKPIYVVPLGAAWM